MLEAGQQGEYRWFSGRVRADESLSELTVACHLGLRLAISSFDSGRLRPTADEVADGWTERGDLALSPPLQAGMNVPQDQYDEWYVFDEQSLPEWSPEVFVNLGTFTVVPVEELERRRDPTWERDALDWLIPVQERFWKQLARIRPVSYVAMGESDIVVTRSQLFAARLSGVR
jgi:hypothetical protein